MKTLNFNFDNVSGISLMYAIPVSSFHQCIQDPITGYGSLSLVNPDNIIDIPIYIGDRFTQEEVHQLADGGDCWDVSISGIIPTRCQLNEKTIHSLERGEWLTLTQDSNGVITLMGSVDVPLKFTHTRTTGTSGDMNGSSFVFSARQPEPSIVLSALPSVI